jgi:hypothetical protein
MLSYKSSKSFRKPFSLRTRGPDAASRTPRCPQALVITPSTILDHPTLIPLVFRVRPALITASAARLLRTCVGGYRNQRLWSLSPSTFSHRPPSMSVSSPAQPAGLTLGDLPEVSDRPGSPTDSVVSGPIPPLNRAMHRFHVGSGDGQKAAPAIGSSRANATGHLEPTSKMRPEGSPERSGRTSPVSTAGTVLGQHWQRPSLAPISTYGLRTALLIIPLKAE